MTFEHKSWFYHPHVTSGTFQFLAIIARNRASIHSRLHKQHDWGRHRMIGSFYTNQLFPAPPFTFHTLGLYVLLAVFNIFKTTTILRSSRANLSGPYLPMYGPHLWLFLFVAFPVKNCQWWHLSNVTKVNRQSRSSERDKKFNYKTPRGNKRVLASSCVLYFNNVQGISRLSFQKCLTQIK